MLKRTISAMVTAAFLMTQCGLGYALRQQETIETPANAKAIGIALATGGTQVAAADTTAAAGKITGTCNDYDELKEVYDSLVKYKGKGYGAPAFIQIFPGTSYYCYSLYGELAALGRMTPKVPKGPVVVAQLNEIMARQNIESLLISGPAFEYRNASLSAIEFIEYIFRVLRFSAETNLAPQGEAVYYRGPKNLDCRGLVFKISQFKANGPFEVEVRTPREAKGVIVRDISNEREMRRKARRVSKTAGDRGFTIPAQQFYRYYSAATWFLDTVKSPLEGNVSQLEDLSRAVYTGSGLNAGLFLLVPFNKTSGQKAGDLVVMTQEELAENYPATRFRTLAIAAAAAGVTFEQLKGYKDSGIVVTAVKISGQIVPDLVVTSLDRDRGMVDFKTVRGGGFSTNFKRGLKSVYPAAAAGAASGAAGISTCISARFVDALEGFLENNEPFSIKYKKDKGSDYKYVTNIAKLTDGTGYILTTGAGPTNILIVNLGTEVEFIGTYNMYVEYERNPEAYKAREEAMGSAKAAAAGEKMSVEKTIKNILTAPESITKACFHVNNATNEVPRESWDDVLVPKYTREVAEWSRTSIDKAIVRCEVIDDAIHVYPMENEFVDESYISLALSMLDADFAGSNFANARQAEGGKTGSIFYIEHDGSQFALALAMIAARMKVPMVLIAEDGAAKERITALIPDIDPSNIILNVESDVSWTAEGLAVNKLMDMIPGMEAANLYADNMPSTPPIVSDIHIRYYGNDVVENMAALSSLLKNNMAILDIDPTDTAAWQVFQKAQRLAVATQV